MKTKGLILGGLFAPEQARHQLRIIREHLLFPDGARLIDRPVIQPPFDPASLTTWGLRIVNGANGIKATSKQATIYGTSTTTPPTTTTSTTRSPRITGRRGAGRT